MWVLWLLQGVYLANVPQSSEMCNPLFRPFRTMLQQLEERQAAAAARAAALGGGAAGALGLRVQQLEEQLRLKDSELKRVMAQAQQAAAAAATSAVNAAQTLANSGGSDGAGIAPSAQTAATVSAALAAELGAVQARLRAWEQGLLQQVLAASCDSCGSTPEEAAAAIKHFAQQVPLADVLCKCSANWLLATDLVRPANACSHACLPAAPSPAPACVR